MIAHVSGVVSDKLHDSLVIDAHGVGYEVQMTFSDFEKSLIGQEVKFYTHHHIREQSQELFGFLDKNALALFRQLLGVKSVGPKVALAVLDIGPADTIRVSIASGDVAFLQNAKGVGKRAAEQIVVELRDKVGLASSSGAEHIVGRSGIDYGDEALQALVTLGYSDIDAHKALSGVSNDLSVEDRIKKALKAV